MIQLLVPSWQASSLARPSPKPQPQLSLTEPKGHWFTFHPTDLHHTTDSNRQHAGRHVTASQSALYS